MNDEQRIRAAAARVGEISKGHHGRWHVVPVSKNHIDDLVIECVDAKFRDMSLFMGVVFALEADRRLIEREFDMRPHMPISQEGAEFLRKRDVERMQPK